MVISNGNYQRIGIRHRRWATLFLGRTVKISEDPGYLKSLVGLYLAAQKEVTLRHEKETADAAQLSSKDLLRYSDSVSSYSLVGEIQVKPLRSSFLS